VTDAFAVEVVSPEQSLVAGAAEAVVLRTAEGFLTVLDGHAPLIGTVEPGEVRVELEGGEVVRLAVHGGFVQIDTSPGAAEGLVEGDGPIPGLSTRVTVLAGIAELSTEIDVERAQRSKESAETRLSELRSTTSRGVESGSGEGDDALERDIADQQSKLARAEVRLDIASASAG
jgi:F-type H+-transporting ATPase subunit epsilon